MSIQPVPPYPEVTIGDSVDYETYATLSDADAYMNGGLNAAAWAALPTDQRGRLLVEATRIFDAQAWQGTPTNPNQGHAWPRVGLTFNGEPIPTDELPTNLVYATIELAWYVQTTPSIITSPSVQNTKKRQKAGSVEIEYFREFNQSGQRYPLPVLGLIAQWLSGTGMGGALVTGVDGKSKASKKFNVWQGF